MARSTSGVVFDGSVLRAARLAKGYGLHKLAVQLATRGADITAEGLRHFELGVTEPRVSLFYELARVLDRKPDHFLKPRER